MAALDYLRQVGLRAESIGGRLRLRPSERITDAVRHFVRNHKNEILAELLPTNSAASKPPSCWLVLAMKDGSVIQRSCTGSDAAEAVDKAHQQYGEALLNVKALPDCERPLTNADIFQARAGTLASSAFIPVPPEQSTLCLALIADLLNTSPAELLAHRHLEQYDLTELFSVDPKQVAAIIRASPAWLTRAMRAECPVEATAEVTERLQKTAFTANKSSPI
ncbi:hypothetical protein JQR88_06135 [Pseudomonas luteola]|uniref:hypothetical protein n=1 Tax=Pseudomonas luteola TaxID=47886 RepID=UPI003DA1A1A4